MPNNIDNKLSNSILSEIGIDEVTTLEQLYELQFKNAPSNVFLPFAHNTYDIDLSNRKINGPEILSISRDHQSEIIYFKVDRFYDYMDLATTICVIQYIIPRDEERVPYIYVVPFYDTSKFASENKMIFPWVVGDAATQRSGDIEYAIRFFKIDGEGENLQLIYNLNTLPTKSKVLSNIEGNNEIMKAEYNKTVEKYENLIAQIVENKTYWTFL